jgi:hypothetical protein
MFKAIEISTKENLDRLENQSFKSTFIATISKPWSSDFTTDDRPKAIRLYPNMKEYDSKTKSPFSRILAPLTFLKFTN